LEVLVFIHFKNFIFLCALQIAEGKDVQSRYFTRYFGQM